ncbi:MAG: tyrosine-type recombinase/integrase [Bacteroidetes bacterium]|nr:tyrosine-type recombinase/integrase [Bacteroidota bacterium]
MQQRRTPTRKKAKELAKYLSKERPDYPYLKRLFKDLRKELDIEVLKTPKKLPYVPTEEEVKNYYEIVWNAKNFQDMLIIKTLLYTGVRVSELINIKLSNIDLNAFQIKIVQGKGKKDRIVPFSQAFRETLAMHIEKMKKDHAKYLFESNRKKKYTDRAIRYILGKYSDRAKLSRPLFPHALRHFLFTWLKKQRIDDALIQPYSGHDSRKSLEIYSKLSITEAQIGYDEVMKSFPV